MNFKEITEKTDFYNFHTHTQFCDGRSTIQEMVDAASDAGFQHLGFTPHSPLMIDSPCNMSRESVDTYIGECERMKQSSRELRIYTSMEIDFLSPDWGAHIDYFQKLPLDYRISSVHFVPNQDGVYVDCDGSPARFQQYLHQAFADDLRYVVERFYEQTIIMLERGGFDIIAHFDKIGRNASSVNPEIESEHWYEALVDDVISHIISSGVYVEVNTKMAERENRIFPSKKWMPKVLSSGADWMVNSDAHYADLLNAGREQAISYIKELLK
jgi:histidinol-phosphatase (PHP family)